MLALCTNKGQEYLYCVEINEIAIYRARFVRCGMLFLYIQNAAKESSFRSHGVC